MLRKLGIIGIVALLASLLLAGVALALVITVDGTVNPADEWGTGNQETCTIGQAGCSRAIDDGRDVANPQVDWYDIQNVHVTNDANNLYMRVDFFGDNFAAGAAGTVSDTWTTTANGRPLLTICLDIDANGATGGSLPPGYCNGAETMTGIDYVIQILARSSGTPALPRIYAWDGTGPWIDILQFNAFTNGAVGYQWSGNALTEIGLPWSALGYTAGSHLCPLSNLPQPCSYRMSMFYDNGVAASDDSVPNSGMATNLFGCDIFGACSPTAITLTSMSANAETKNTTPLILAGASVVCAAIAVFLIRRKKTA